MCSLLLGNYKSATAVRTLDFCWFVIFERDNTIDLVRQLLETTNRFTQGTTETRVLAQYSLDDLLVGQV